MSNTSKQIDDFFSDFGVPEQPKLPQIQEPEVEEVKEVELQPVDVYAKWLSDYEKSRL